MSHSLRNKILFVLGLMGAVFLVNFAATYVVVNSGADAQVTMERAIYVQVFSLFLGAAASLLCLNLMNRWVIGPISIIAERARSLAKGDLTVRELRMASKDEVGQTATAFNQTVRNLRTAIGLTSTTGAQLAQRSREMMGAVEQAATATTHITTAIHQVAEGASNQSLNARETVEAMGQLRRAIDEIASGAQQQAAGVHNTSQFMENMAQAINDVARSAAEVAEMASDALSSARVGGSAVQQTLEGMVRIRNTSTEVADRVRELGEHSQQIGEIVQLISDIADQTNLLALNAAIEAARAGESGKGFSVVAEEVRKLAERSGRATQEIASLVNSIQHSVQAAHEAMAVGTREVAAGSALADSTGKALEQILSAMERTTKQAQGISTTMEKVSSEAGDVVRAVNDVASIVEENSAATEEMAAASAQVARAVQVGADVSQATATSAEGVNTSSREVEVASDAVRSTASVLNHLSESLGRLVGKFNIDTTAGFMPWSDDFTVHVGALDTQHQRLFQLADELFAAVMSFKDRQKVASVLRELIDYTQTHFADEERLMREAGYPDYTQHKAIHERLMRQVGEYAKRFDEGGDVALTLELLDFLKEWLIGHILETDTKYSPYVQRAERGKGAFTVTRQAARAG